jgi:hypothetical protein
LERKLQQIGTKSSFLLKQSYAMLETAMKYKHLIPILCVCLLLGAVSPAFAAAGDLQLPLVTGTPTTSSVDSPTTSRTPTPTQKDAQTATITPSPTAAETPTPAPPTETPYPVVVPLIINEPTPVGYGPVEYDFGVNPLTGMQVDDPTRLERRPIAIKITNYPRYVRPQSGLSQADIVYEYYMERGVPRFIAIFYGKDAPRVGPVRSGRFFDEHVVRMHDAYFVFGSADKRVLNYFLQIDEHFKNSLVIESPEDREHDCNAGEFVPLCRDKSLETYNNLFTNTAALTQYLNWKGSSNDKPDLTGMRFAFRTPLGGEVALNVYTRFSLFMYNQWAFSMDSGKYLRFQETIGKPEPDFESYEPLTDALTGEQLSADNVVVLIVDYDFFVKTNTTEMMDVNLYGSGKAFAFRDGYMFPVRWERPQEGGVLRLYSPNGEPYPLKPGTTWYEVMSEESEYYNDGVDWRFTFNLPDLPAEPLNPTVKPPFTPTPRLEDQPFEGVDATPTPVE